MDCKDIQERMASHLLDEEEFSFVEEELTHVEECAECGRRKLETERVLDIATRVSEVDVPRETSRKVIRALEDAAKESPPEIAASDAGLAPRSKGGTTRRRKKSQTDMFRPKNVYSLVLDKIAIPLTAAAIVVVFVILWSTSEFETAFTKCVSATSDAIVIPKGSNKSRPFGLHDTLGVGDILKLDGEDTVIALRRRDSVIITASNYAFLSFSAPGEVELTRGTLIINTRNGRSINVVSGDAVITTLGTDFRVDAAPGMLRVAVSAGKIKLACPKGTREIEAGSMCFAGTGGVPSPPLHLGFVNGLETLAPLPLDTAEPSIMVVVEPAGKVCVRVESHGAKNGTPARSVFVRPFDRMVPYYYFEIETPSGESSAVKAAGFLVTDETKNMSVKTTDSLVEILPGGVYSMVFDVSGYMEKPGAFRLRAVYQTPPDAKTPELFHGVIVSDWQEIEIE